MLDNEASEWEQVATLCLELNIPYCAGGLIDQPAEWLELMQTLRALRGTSLGDALTLT